ncbi:uncharacterized protein PV09_02428 [Verruconis gallopava]|uniref:N-acetyltransferase domain-containing protein n=1 Tax=Verruconis gallopava TaxID=253628 RepID=A0A0D2AJG9_9PEZI|nr:uncharacterized protein PV09_02428 [Verruconis gallopava]KIW06735.1 hypothetical protein PV09_02428 [Verruconis gallopava]
MEFTSLPNTDFIVIPKSCRDASLWSLLVEKSKRFRLNSLKESPEAFASTYEREKAFEDSVWADRLSSLRATTVVGVERFSGMEVKNKDDDSAMIRALVESSWQSTTVVVEPPEEALASLSASRSPWHAITTTTDASVEPGPSKKITFVLNGVYVAPAFREQGIGKATLHAAVSVGRSIAAARGRHLVHFQVRVDTANTAASSLYEKAGFHEVRREHLNMGTVVRDGLVRQREAVVAVLDRVDSLDDT